MARRRARGIRRRCSETHETRGQWTITVVDLTKSRTTINFCPMDSMISHAAIALLAIITSTLTIRPFSFFLIMKLWWSASLNPLRNDKNIQDSPMFLVIAWCKLCFSLRGWPKVKEKKWEWGKKIASWLTRLNLSVYMPDASTTEIAQNVINIITNM